MLQIMIKIFKLRTKENVEIEILEITQQMTISHDLGLLIS